MVVCMCVVRAKAALKRPQSRRFANAEACGGCGGVWWAVDTGKIEDEDEEEGEEENMRKGKCSWYECGP